MPVALPSFLNAYNLTHCLVVTNNIAFVYLFKFWGLIKRSWCVFGFIERNKENIHINGIYVLVLVD